MPQWIITLLGKWPDFIINILGTLLGALLAFVVSILIWRIQNKKDMELRSDIYLTNLLNEFEYNIKLLQRIRIFIVAGPDIDHLWAPAETNASFLVTDAWNDLVLSGILKVLGEYNVKKLQTANRTVIDAKRVINEVAVNWYRVQEWHEHDKAMGNQQLSQRRLFKDTAINETTGRVDYAINKLDESIKLIKSILIKIRNNHTNP